MFNPAAAESLSPDACTFRELDDPACPCDRCDERRAGECAECGQALSIPLEPWLDPRPCGNCVDNLRAEAA